MQDIKHYYDLKRKSLTRGGTLLKQGSGEYHSSTDNPMYIVNSYKMIDGAMNNGSSLRMSHTDHSESMDKS